MDQSSVTVLAPRDGRRLWRVGPGRSALAYYREARINWTQADDQSLSIGLNKHAFTESLLPLIPKFKRLTGIGVEHLILPDAELAVRAAGLDSAARRLPSGTD